MKVKQLIQAMFHPADTHRSIESQALYFAMGSGVASLIVALIHFWVEGALPIFGRVSIGATAVVLAPLTAFVAYIYVLYQRRTVGKKLSWNSKLYRFLSNCALSFVHAAIVFLLATVGFFVMSDAFVGAKIDIYASSVIIAAISGVVGYIVYLLACHKSSLMISGALAVFLVMCVLTSMITSQDPYWWQYHLSDLGTVGGVASYAFNFTLILGGMVIICLADLTLSFHYSTSCIKSQWSLEMEN